MERFRLRTTHSGDTITTMDTRESDAMETKSYDYGEEDRDSITEVTATSTIPEGGTLPEVSELMSRQQREDPRLPPLVRHARVPPLPLEKLPSNSSESPANSPADEAAVNKNLITPDHAYGAVEDEATFSVNSVGDETFDLARRIITQKSSTLSIDEDCGGFQPSQLTMPAAPHAGPGSPALLNLRFDDDCGGFQPAEAGGMAAGDGGFGLGSFIAEAPSMVEQIGITASNHRAPYQGSGKRPGRACEDQGRLKEESGLAAAIKIDNDEPANRSEDSTSDNESRVHAALGLNLKPHSATSTTTRATAEVDEVDEREEEDRVVFEGAYRHMIAVDKNATFFNLLVQDQAARDAYHGCFETYKLSIVFMVVGLVILIGSVPLFTQNVDPKLFYTACAVMPLWLNMLSTRSPQIMKMLIRFDFVFMSTNFLVFCICLCWEFSWDARSLAIMVAFLPAFWLCLTIDTCCSDFEFGVRKFVYTFTPMVIGSLIFLNEGGFYFNARDSDLIFDVSSWEWCFDCNMTAATATTDDALWATHSVYNVRSIGDVRGMFAVVYALHILFKTIMRPEQCATLDKAARRRFVAAVSEGSEGARRSQPAGAAQPATLLRGVQHVSRTMVNNVKKGVPDDIACMDLDARSKAVVDTLNDDDEIILYAPVQEFSLTNGPADSFLCHLMCWIGLDEPVKRAAATNKWLHDNRQLEESAWLPLFLLGFVSMTGVIPHQFTHLVGLNLFDAVRVICRYNYPAMCKCTRNVFEFWVPAFFGTAGVTVAWISFGQGGDHGAQIFCVITYLAFISLILFGDCDLSRERIEKGPSHVINFGSFILFTTWVLFFTLGAFPTARNVVFTMNIFNRTVRMDARSLFSRCMSTPLIYVLLFCIKALRHPNQCAVIKVPLGRTVLKKHELPEFIEAYRGDRTTRMMKGEGAADRSRRPTRLSRFLGGSLRSSRVHSRSSDLDEGDVEMGSIIPPACPPHVAASEGMEYAGVGVECPALSSHQQPPLGAQQVNCVSFPYAGEAVRDTTREKLEARQQQWQQQQPQYDIYEEGVEETKNAMPDEVAQNSAPRGKRTQGGVRHDPEETPEPLTIKQDPDHATAMMEAFEQAIREKDWYAISGDDDNSVDASRSAYSAASAYSTKSAHSVGSIAAKNSMKRIIPIALDGYRPADEMYDNEINWDTPRSSTRSDRSYVLGLFRNPT